MRLIYRWDPDRAYVEIVVIGRDVRHGEIEHAYEALADMYALPLDEGHRQLPAKQCCEGVDSPGRILSEEEACKRIKRMAKR